LGRIARRLRARRTKEEAVTTQLLPPVELDVVVPLTPERAFAFFATPGEWWPLRRFSVFADDAATCTIEPFAGGAVFEVSAGGERSEWGRVLVWDPPHRLAMTWHPGREASEAQQVEVRFAAEGDGTRVTLLHFGWEALGERAAEVRERYAHGWVAVLQTSYAGAAKESA
jgi:uncharacterized protein YndB with AHSA1/START domain